MGKAKLAAIFTTNKEIRLGELIKRCDIVIYDRNATPLLMTECKAMEIEINATAAEQILRYNISLPVRYLVITNGSYCFAFERTGKDFHPLIEIPEWKDE